MIWDAKTVSIHSKKVLNFCFCIYHSYKEKMTLIKSSFSLPRLNENRFFQVIFLNFGIFEEREKPENEL